MVDPILLVTVAVVLGGAALAVTAVAAVVVGRRGLGQLARNLRTRPRATLEPLALLVAVLLVNKVLRDVSPELSHLIGWNVTGLIYAVEGPFVAHVQSVATPPLTLLLSVVYLSGYVFLLTFPLLAYAATTDLRQLERVALGLSLNYALGLVLYTLFVSYGPRNLLPDLVDPLLYRAYPWTQLLTSQVNTNTNVFPSLHTSLSVTVALFSLQTRETYPSWPLVAVPVAVAVVFSTMYLGIHWGIDVVAGAVLGVASVRLATRYR